MDEISYDNVCIGFVVKIVLYPNRFFGIVSPSLYAIRT